MLGRDDEALALLRRSLETSESLSVAQALFALESELEMHADALHSLERMEQLALLAEALAGTARYRACRKILRETTRLISRRLGRMGPKLWGQWQLLVRGDLRA
jgi:hypothetical protein